MKRQLSDGVSVIVFVSIPNDVQYFYLVDSLAENKNADGNRYNRKLTIDEFDEVWKTDTVLPDNVYIVVKRSDGYTVQ